MDTGSETGEGKNIAIPPRRGMSARGGMVSGSAWSSSGGGSCSWPIALSLVEGMGMTRKVAFILPAFGDDGVEPKGGIPIAAMNFSFLIREAHLLPREFGYLSGFVSRACTSCVAAAPFRRRPPGSGRDWCRRAECGRIRLGCRRSDCRGSNPRPCNGNTSPDGNIHSGHRR